MSSRGRWRLITAAIVAFTILGAVGWQQFAPRPMSPTTIMITPTVTTVTGSQTTVIPQRQTEWIRIGEVKPVNYYLSLLESTGTQPYVQLAKELRKLPDLTNATAVARITYLALNATNPEVKEAFELMIKGGTPDRRDYSYSVANYNTELQVLYWLACQSEFKQDDTLALAIAMVNGLWLTIGTDEVKAAVRKDAYELLGFLRETGIIQKKKGHFSLEEYPLEAKVALVWTGNKTPTAGYYSLTNYRGRQLPLKGYDWNTVSTETLRRMQKIANEKGWFDSETDLNVMRIEEYLYFTGSREHWNYTCYEDKDPKILVDGELVSSCGIFNVDWQFEQFLKTNRFMGGCADEASVANAWLISIGESSTISSVRWGPTGFTGHFHVCYYEPRRAVWKIYYEQLKVDQIHGSGKNPVNVFYVLVPPTNQSGYILWRDTIEQNLWIWRCKAYFMLYPTTIDTLSRMFSDGLASLRVKQWLLYS